MATSNFIPGRLPKAHIVATGGGGTVVSRERREPALHSGAEFIARLKGAVETDLAIKEIEELYKSETYASDSAELLKDLNALELKTSAPTRRQKAAAEKLPLPPANEPILIRRTVVPTEALFLEEAVDKVPWVNRCLNLKAQNIASVPLRVMRRQKNGDQAEQDDDTPVARKILRLLERPNAHMSATDLIEAISFWMNTRQCLLWMMGKDRERTKPQDMQNTPPVALYCLPAHRCTGMMSDGSLLYYRLNGSGMNIPAWQIIRLGFYNPKEEFRCLSPLSAAFQAADTSYATELWNTNFFTNGAKPSGLISIKGEASEEKMNKYRAMVNQMSGVGNAHMYGFFDNDATFTSMATSTKDMDFPNLAKMNKEVICASFGVPLIMVGDAEHTNKATADVARRLFWQDVLVPEARKLQDKLNVHLVPTFGDDDVYLEFDWSKVQALSEDRTEFAQAFLFTAQAINFLSTLQALNPDDIANLLKDKFGLEVQGQFEDDPYEDDEEIMEEAFRNRMLRQIKNLTMNYLHLPPEQRKRKSLQQMILAYLLHPRRDRKPTPVQAEEVAALVTAQVRSVGDDPKAVALYFKALERAGR